MLLVGTSWGQDPGLVRVDQGFADRDALSTSLRHLQPDLRNDVGFEHLYVDSEDPGRFVRVSGALRAVSPRTDYVSLREGVFAAVSPGTVFYIGPVPDEQFASLETDRGLGTPAPGSERVSASVTTGVSAARRVRAAVMAVRAAEIGLDPREGETSGAPAEAGAGGRDMADASYRAARLRQIARQVGGAD